VSLVEALTDTSKLFCLTKIKLFMKKLISLSVAFVLAFSMNVMITNAEESLQGGCIGTGECVITYPDGKVVHSTGSWREF
jgi:hypothetical protein